MEKDMGDSCYDPSLPEAIVLLSKDLDRARKFNTQLAH